MKYYSEITKKFYDDEESLTKDEQSIMEKKNATATRKKDKVKAIEEAKLAVDKAYDNFDSCKQEAAKILEESNKQVEELLNKGREEIKEAESAYYKQIKEFNKDFGEYKVYLSGDDAIREAVRIENRLFRDNSLFRSLFNNMFKF